VAEPKTTVIAVENYDQAVNLGRKTVAQMLAAPTLFSWFVGLTAIIVALSSILPLRLLEVYQVSQLAGWLIPIRLWLLLGGAGLIYTEIRPEMNRWWNLVFRGSLVIAFYALALLWWQSIDIYGVCVAGLIGTLVMLELITEVSTLKSFTLYSLGLIISLWVTAIAFPQNNTWLSLVRTFPWLPTWPVWLIGLVIAVFSALAAWSYFAHKQRLSYLIAVTALPIAALSLFFAGESDWQKTFILMMSALFVALVPFWDELSFRRPEIRGLVVRMFGGLLGIFVVTIILIYLAQNLLVQNVSETLQDKVTYGRIQTDLVVGGADSAIRGMSQNPLLLSTINGPDENRLALARNLYESNLNLYKVVITDADGTVLASYPTGGAIVTSSLADQDYFRDGLSNQEGAVSGLITNFEGSGNDVVAMAQPITESSGKVVGVLVGYLNLPLLNDSLSAIATPRTKQYFILLDGQGRWLLWPESLDNIEKKEGDTYVQELSRNGLIRRGYAWDGHLSLSASQPLSANNWQITIIVPFFEALSVKQTAYVAVLAIAGLSILIIGITILSERAKKAP
jgi:hypothetical protein